MKKISSKQIFSVVAVLGVLALVVVYMLVYKKYYDMAESLKASNEVLAERVESLKGYYLQEPQYKAEMEPLKLEIDEILAPYPADTREEDVIMQAVHTQMLSPIVYSSLNLGEKAVIKSVGADTVTNAGIEKYQQEIVFVERSCSYPNQITYDGLKLAVQSLLDSEYMIGIKSITYSAGEEEMLNGTLDLSFYSVKGAGKEYVAPDIADYAMGTENIFGISER